MCLPAIPSLQATALHAISLQQWWAALAALPLVAVPGRVLGGGDTTAQCALPKNGRLYSKMGAGSVFKNGAEL